MSGPRLNRRMVLETSSRVPDGAGGFQVTWVVQGTLWVAVDPGTGREVGGEEVRLSQVPCRITLRAAPVGSPARPKAEDRLREGGRVYTILAVTEADPQGRYLTCFAREEVPA